MFAVCILVMHSGFWKGLVSNFIICPYPKQNYFWHDLVFFISLIARNVLAPWTEELVPLIHKSLLRAPRYFCVVKQMLIISLEHQFLPVDGTREELKQLFSTWRCSFSLLWLLIKGRTRLHLWQSQNLLRCSAFVQIIT